MNTNIKKVALIWVLVVALIGCIIIMTSNRYRKANPRFSPNIKAVDGYFAANCEYLIDEDRGVVYLYVWRSGQAALTVMLNPDGTPVSIEQLQEIRNSYK